MKIGIISLYIIVLFIWVNELKDFLTCCIKE